MMSPLERRQAWNRIIGVERRAALIGDLQGRPLPDPTRLEDEEFFEAQAKLAELEKRKPLVHSDRWNNPTRFS